MSFLHIFIKKTRPSLRKELFRKMVHIAGSLTIFYDYFITKESLSLLLVITMFCYSIAEYLRIHKHNIFVISWITEKAARENEIKNFISGPITLALGILIIVNLFDNSSFRVGLLALCIGDGLASLSGKTFHSPIIPFTGGKTVAGVIANFIVIFTIAYIEFGFFYSALILGLLGAFVEALPLKNWDNIFLPLSISSCCMLLGF